MTLNPENSLNNTANTNQSGNSNINTESSAPESAGDRISGSDSNIEKQQLEDGRNKEWADRGRINMHPDPGAKTNLERDFEPEESDNPEEDKPAY